MKDFSDLFTEEYNTQRDQWEKALKGELKLDDVSGKVTKKHLDLGVWPTLSLESSVTHKLTSQNSWKKAAQTYAHIPTNIQALIQEDLEGGVRAFFFSSDFLQETQWSDVQKTFLNFSKSEELEIYLLGKKIFSADKKLNIVQGSALLSASEIHEEGGHNVHELALLTLKLIDNIDSPPTHIAAFMDSHFFKNIAKFRAMKLLVQKVSHEAKISSKFSFLALNSYREWTLFERYSNMLRNNVQVASGYIAGADAIQSSGYQMIFDFETDHVDPVHHERSLRMARNTSHILGLESMLGIVDDAAFGSYHLETLSEKYAEEAWKLMQKLLPLSKDERDAYLAQELSQTRETRLERVKTRKDVLTGMNDFPDGKEHLGLSLKAPKAFRVSRPFEEARLKIEKLKTKPKVQIALLGDYGALNNRINFIKNYFELMGLEVIDPIQGLQKLDSQILVLCAADSDYPALAEKIQNEKAIAKFVAGKVDVPGFQAIHAGQNIFMILSELVSKIEAIK